MASAPMRIAFGLLTFVTVGMIIGTHFCFILLFSVDFMHRRLRFVRLSIYSFDVKMEINDAVFCAASDSYFFFYVAVFGRTGMIRGLAIC